MCSEAYHRHPIFCILPPHILRHIARRGSAPQRDRALDALSNDATTRTNRVIYSMMETRAHQTLLAAGPARKQRSIYDAGHAEILPGSLVRSEGQPGSGDPAIDEAYDGLGATFDFYYDAYHRNSIDDEGLHLDATVHYGQDYDNAFWNGQQMVFGDGDRELFNRFTISLDVIGHELTHGVTSHESGLIYSGQPGALNESMSDVFGSLVKQYALKQTADQGDWLIGAGLLAPGINGVALRSMKEPGTAYADPTLGKDPQPATMTEYVQTTSDNGGVHINSGIPNRAFYLLATNLGGFAWERAGRIWYETLRDKNLPKTATFSNFALRTVFNAGHLYGGSSPERSAVVAAWNGVGIKVP
jgi:Zn-dependent metalloprotease